MSDIVVIYHGNCPDGFGGAWAAWKKFGNDANYLPAAYGEDPITDLKDKDIYLIDFSYSQSIIEKLKIKNQVIIIDHHKTAEAASKVAHKYLFDVNHSGAWLAWQYFHPEKPVPRLSMLLEEGDLWRYSDNDSKLILERIYLEDRNFDAWEKMATDLEDVKKIREYVMDGRLLKKQFDSLVKETAKYKYLIEFKGIKTYAVNAPHFLASNLGVLLYTSLPPMAIIWRHDGNQIKVSLRSDKSVDVGKLAQEFGGGGHPFAAGFELPSDAPIPWKPIKL